MLFGKNQKNEFAFDFKSVQPPLSHTHLNMLASSQRWVYDTYGCVALASDAHMQLLFEYPANMHRAPLTIMQAFAVALSSFADKLAVT